jgi:toxin CptA
MQIAAFPIALAAAALMGFANQRGGVCMVASVKEIVARRRFGRLLALLEASLWVTAGFILLDAARLMHTVPSGYAPGLATVAGGVLFGLGAVLNNSCLFGTVARLGAGQWAYAATPVGLFLGGLVAGRWRFAAEATHAPSPVLGASALGLAAALVFIGWRLFAHGVRIRRARRPIWEHLSSPHVATTVIGLAFLVAFVAWGAWDYADFLRGLGQGDVAGWLPKSLLALALLSGAVVGGKVSGAFRLVRPDLARVAGCLAGGGLMGAGATLIPGGNTSLSLFGLPLLRPHAWLGIAVICVTIYAAILVAGFFSPGRRGATPSPLAGEGR